MKPGIGIRKSHEKSSHAVTMREVCVCMRVCMHVCACVYGEGEDAALDED